MGFPELRLALDTGTLVLIWLVQLVIYPGFLHYRNEDLIRWHQRYTVQVTFVVLPLMAGQLLVVSVQLCKEQYWYSIVSLLLVVFSWAATFLRFVPLHDRITSGQADGATLQRLVAENWWRTGAWSLLWILTIVQYG
ncbi:MAG: hypothetical protein AAGB22_14520 [Bacteroidota bacterium]